MKKIVLCMLVILIFGHLFAYKFVDRGDGNFKILDDNKTVAKGRYNNYGHLNYYLMDDTFLGSVNISSFKVYNKNGDYIGNLQINNNDPYAPYAIAYKMLYNNYNKSNNYNFGTLYIIASTKYKNLVIHIDGKEEGVISSTTIDFDTLTPVKIYLEEGKHKVELGIKYSTGDFFVMYTKLVYIEGNRKTTVDFR